MKCREVEEGLRRKGFELVRKKNDSHKYFYLRYPDDKINYQIGTKIQDHGNIKDIKMADIKRMRKQLKLRSLKDFKDLINCPKSKDQYISELKADKHLR
ncbi:MAG: hypothetical protein WC993_03165 [Methanoculleus sp.]